MRTYYPPIEAYRTGMLKVSDLHTLYFEESGNLQGKPVVFVHGGPGGGTNPDHRRFFNPKAYRIILFDQRGCGKSTPFAELRDNTTADLVADMEKLRMHLGIEKWQVFGGSWGSTLGLAYAQAHPEVVAELVLRGIFLCRKSEIIWLYQEGAHQLFPDRFAAYYNFIPAAERGDMVAAYYKRLTGDDEAVKLEAARLWTKWEMSTSQLQVPDDVLTREEDAKFALPFARIEAHYFVNNAFMAEGALLKDEAIARIAHIPTFIVHGRYDVVCPVRSAFDLHAKLPHSELVVVPDAGHASFEPGILSALVTATDRFAGLDE